MRERDTSTITIEPMSAAALDSVERLQAQAYPAPLVEPIDTHTARLKLAPSCCFIARDVSGGAIVGYIIAHPWDAHTSPGLGVTLTALPERPEALHIHDLALELAYGGRGIGPMLIDAALMAGRALGLEVATLVAVAGAHTFWARHGFEEVGRASYDPQSRLMRRALGAR